MGLTSFRADTKFNLNVIAEQHKEVDFHVRLIQIGDLTQYPDILIISRKKTWREQNVYHQVKAGDASLQWTK